MPPKKNKGGKNGFFYFMMEYKNTQGRRFRNMQEASEAAGEIWKKMGPAQRAPYSEKAAIEKEADRGGVKLTALHENVDDLKKLELSKKNAEKDMELDINGIIKRALHTDSLGKQVFIIMHVNNFCYSNTENRHFPAEIAALKFNLEDGVLKENIYHEIVRPGPLPMGYSYKAKQTSTESHQLPTPIGESDCNMEEIMAELISFLDIDEEETTRIYVHERQIKLVSEVLTQMCHDYEVNIKLFKFYSLQYLLFALHNGISQNVWPNINQSVIELERDVYDFTTGISCEFHEDSDVPIHCSKSMVTRYAFIVCDNCCSRIGIKLIPGQHVPKKSYFGTNDALSVSSYGSAKNHTSSICSSIASTMHTDHNFDYVTVSSQDEHEEGEWTEPQFKSRRKKYSDESRIGSGNASFHQPSGSQNSHSVTSSREPLRRPNTKSGSLVDPLTFSNIQPGRGRARPKY